jgi:hypothetical protein
MNQKISEAWKTRLVILLVLAFFASITSFLRSYLFGFDSYASIVCQTQGDCGMLGMQPLMIFVLKVLPFHPVLLNLIFWLVCFSTFLALFLLGNHFCKDERKVWIALLVLISFCPFFVFHLHEWENEMFAYPLLLFGLWFVLEKKWLPSVGMFVLAGLFWAGSAYILVPWAFLAVEGWLILPFVGSCFVFGVGKGLQLLSSSSVSESVFGWGLLDLFLLVFVLPFSLGFSAGEMFLACGLVVGIIFSLIQGKLIFCLVPFVLLGLLNALELCEKRNINTNTLIPLAFFMLLCMNVAFLGAEPTTKQMSLTKESIELSKDANIQLYNDWSYGYWLNYYGFKTKFDGTKPNPDYNNLQRPFMALTDHNLSPIDCTIIKERGIITKVWRC